MVIQDNAGMMRVTVTLDPEDVRLLDALAAFEGQNRSAELRGLLRQIRPVMKQLVETFEVVSSRRLSLDEAMKNASISELEMIQPDLDEISKRFMGAMAKLEGAAAAAAGDGDAPASNTGATGDNS